MAGITGMGDTFDLPNYAGELIALTPSDTPLLSLSGGINGGGMTAATSFEWQTYDLGATADADRAEGADAPTAGARVRANVQNVAQIFHEAVTTSYSKQATSRELTTPGAAPFTSNDGSPNPVTNEHAWQVQQTLKQISRNVNFAFWHGTYNQPTAISGYRKTQGIIGAATSNAQSQATLVVDADSATDTITPDTAHALAANDKVVFTSVGASTTIRKGVAYWVKSVSTTVSFKIAATRGGTAITVGTAVLSYYGLDATDDLVSVDDVNTLLQSVWDNGGISEQETATLFVNSGQKRRLSAAYADAYGKADPMNRTRNVGGFDLTMIETDFGSLNVVMDREVPQDALVVVSLEQVQPVFLNIPEKGVLFEEELAKTGASEKSQVYGEIGLKYGNERAHGVLRGLFP